jgi:hypothetical protein
LGKVKQWFYTNKDKNTTWENCSTAFLAKFFPAGNTNTLRERISSLRTLSRLYIINVDISNTITNRRVKPFLSKGIRNVWDIS